MKAEPSCNLHEILPVSFTARFTHIPRKIPKAVHLCVIYPIVSVSVWLDSGKTGKNLQLPTHHKASTDSSGRIFGTENRDG